MTAPSTVRNSQYGFQRFNIQYAVQVVQVLVQGLVLQTSDFITLSTELVPVLVLVPVL
jgi:hypothetical protein